MAYLTVQNSLQSPYSNNSRFIDKSSSMRMWFYQEYWHSSHFSTSGYTSQVNLNYHSVILLLDLCVYSVYSHGSNILNVSYCIFKFNLFSSIHPSRTRRPTYSILDVGHLRNIYKVISILELFILGDMRNINLKWWV